MHWQLAADRNHVCALITRVRCQWRLHGLFALPFNAIAPIDSLGACKESAIGDRIVSAQIGIYYSCLENELLGEYIDRQ